VSEEYFKILVVDDSQAMRMLLKDLINRNEITPLVYEAATGREALEKHLEVKPDMVLMDLRMPGIDGLDVIRIMHKIDYSTKIIVITSSTSKTDTQDAIKFGACDIIHKPFSQNEIALKIVKHLRDKIRGDYIRQKNVLARVKNSRPSQAQRI
jgi:DNA-binding response OmpR family regulator